MDISNRDDLLAMPEGFTPSYDNLLEAVKASALWSIAKHNNLGSFHTKVDLCSYAEWCCDKALGRPHDEEWTGVPRIVLERTP